MSTKPAKKTSELPELPAPAVRSVILILLAFGVGYGITRVLEMRNEAPVTGYLYSQTTSVFAGKDGVIKNILTETGKVTEEATSLCTIQSTELQDQISAQKELIAGLNQELKLAKAKSEIELAWRNKSLDQEILETRLNAANYLQEKYNQQIEKHVWKKYLNRPRPVSHINKPEEIFNDVNGIHDLDRYQIRAQLEQESAQNAEEVTTVQLQLCEKRLESLKKLKEELPEKVKESLGISKLEKTIKTEEQKLDELLKKDPVWDIKSNAYGIVGPIKHSSGDRIASGEKLFDIYHPDETFIKVNLPSVTAAKIDQGGIVQLRFPNGEKRRGRIKEKSFVASFVTKADLSSDSEDSQVEIVVEPVGKIWPKVSLGTAVNVRTL